ncbi:hypothetical protein MAC_09701 [Metarhizium acridum CQMa 102]|uniref:AMP-dependent synthetase/ligase domain-containing protein n=1 Tax=Metarhizium acridum (strain CQMa 102) TaxID=655827 RepID=E9EIK3_METAQ|nr:uncharacterized protein MAC_09701 [Metarhizium acridum CQMa 102]EFY84256.1 hypothetical protein MAC_09701 [Metarhizium acridum CQMa 102]
MALENYTLSDVLAVAKSHPFYDRDVQYPADSETIQKLREDSREQLTRASLKLQPLLRKKDLVYASITGGGFGSKPLFFATDVYENRRHRAQFGELLRATGVVKHGDWILTTHCAGELYRYSCRLLEPSVRFADHQTRSLDLMLEILENAGASVLSAGNHMPPEEVIRLLIKYHINVLTGDSSQVAQIIHRISALPQESRALLRLDKIIYTSEVLTAAQRAHIKTVLGDNVKICSIMGSAEAGPWALSNPDLTGQEAHTSEADFIFDTRAMLLEVLSPSSQDGDSDPEPVPEGQQGIVVQTSLSRLRNPLVRYDTGDIGSLHPLPAEAQGLVPEEYWPFLRVLRFQGRDRRFSFDWDGEYLDFVDLTALLNDEECGVLQWQVILDKLEPSLESSLEIRLLRSPPNLKLLSEQDLGERIRTFVHAYSANEHRFRLVFVADLDGFERSSTGRKVIKFIDRYN